MSEPQWMRSIPNDVVCGYFYVISAVILIAGAITVASYIYFMTRMPKMFGMLSMLIVSSLITYGLVFFFYVCLYIMCSRSLVDKKQ